MSTQNSDPKAAEQANAQAATKAKPVSKKAAPKKAPVKKKAATQKTAAKQPEQASNTTNPFFKARRVWPD